MLRKLIAHIKANKRQLRRNIRSNFSRPIKEWSHLQYINLRYNYLILKHSVSRLHNIRFVGMFLIIFWFFRDFAFAADVTTTQPVTATMWIVDLINLMIGILTFVMTPLIMLAGWLLSPDWTFGEVFGLRDVFHRLWVLVANLVYIIFAFVLIYIAFVNIFSDKQKNFAIKEALPKLVVSILIIPFSWFIVSAILSVSNFLVASVIRLPVDTIKQVNGGTFITEPIIPSEITYDKNSSSGSTTPTTSSGYKVNGGLTATDCETNPQGCVSIETLLTKSAGGPYNLLAAYAYGIFKIQNYERIDPTEVNGINAVIDIAKKGGFGLIFFLMFGLLLIAIIFALVSRVFKMWIYVIFSPVFALEHFFSGQGVGKKLESISLKSFISLAFVPVYVSAALAFGLMFLSATMSQTKYAADGSTFKTDIVEIQNGANDDQTFIFGPVKFKTVGVITKKTSSFTSSALDVGKGIIGTIIINFLALAVLWMAVMAALKADKVTEEAAKPFAKIGTDVGGLIKDLPKYTPIPTPMGRMSAQGLSTLTGQAKTTIEQMGIAGATDKGTRFGNYLGEKLGMPNSEAVAALSKLDGRLAGIDLAARAKDDPVATARIIREAIAGMGIDSKKAIEDATIRKGIVEKLALAYGLDESKKSKLMSAGSEDLFNKAFMDIANGNRAMEMLVDGKSGVTNTDKFTEIFAKNSTTEESTKIKEAQADPLKREVTVKYENDKEPKLIKIDTNTKVEDGKPISLAGDDHEKLGKLVTGMGEDKAKELLKKLFNAPDDKVNELFNMFKPKA